MVEMIPGYSRRALFLLLLLMTIPASTAHASDFSFTATVTSEYIFRGLKRSDGDPALQLGVDYEHDSGWFGGLWGSTIELQGPNSNRDKELDFYAGFHHSFQEAWSATVTLVRYTYPGQTGSHSYDYNEVQLRTTLREHYSIELGFTNDYSGLDRDAHYWEFQVDYPIANTWVLGATIGRNDISSLGVSPYFYWDIGASARWSRTVFDLRWFDNETLNGFAARGSAGSQVVLSLGLTF